MSRNEPWLLRRAQTTPAEVATELWLAMARKNTGWESPEHFQNWLRMTAVHILIDRIRRLDKVQTVADEDPARYRSRSFANAEQEETSYRVRDAIQRMHRVHPRPASVVSLRYLEGYTVPECAGRLGVSERTIKRESKTAFSWLRTHLMAVTAMLAIGAAGVWAPGTSLAQMTPDGRISPDRTHFSSPSDQRDAVGADALTATDCSAQTQIPTVECGALVTFFESTGGPSWTTKTGWNTTNEPCSWFGITCSGGHVYAIDLQNNGLSGPIPPEIGLLSSLDFLHLTQNGLNGSLPSELGQLSLLNWLALSQNSLTGSIPKQLGQLNNLTYLFLYSNSLTGPIPAELAQMSSLLGLSLFGNSLSGTIPPELGDLPSLLGLFLYDNNLTGSVPTELGQLSDLDFLRLNHNSLGGTVPLPVAEVGAPLGTNCEFRWNGPSLCMPDTPEYQALGNPICGLALSSSCEPIAEFSCATQTEIPSSECEALVALYDSTGGPSWDDNTGWKTSNEPCAWHGVTCDAGHVTELDLSFNLMTGRIPLQFWDLTALKVILMNYNYYLSGIIPPDVSQLTDLRRIVIYNTSLEGSIPSELGGLDSLRQIALVGNNLTGSIPPELGQLTKLESLDLGYNDLTGSIPAELGETGLVYLNLGSNSLSGAIPPELGQLASMEHLELWDNQLTGSIPPELGELSELSGLSLAGNHLSGSIPPELGQLSKLYELYLSQNELSGSIPAELGNLSGLYRLSIGENNLTGPIPSELGNLDFLRDLYLSGNNLMGPIPPELGTIPWLIALDLSHNNLSGPIPAELGGLPPDILEFFRVQDNNLSGVVPLSVVELLIGLHPDGCSLVDNHPSLCVPNYPPYPTFPDHICGLATSADCATGADSVVFTVDLSAMAATGVFDPQRGDTLEVRGSFNGWNCDYHPDCLMTQRPGENIFEATIPMAPGMGGSTMWYKYYFRQNVTTESAAKSLDFPILEEWEEPYETGGANRSFVLAESGSPNQVLETVGFNDIIGDNVIPAGDSIEVTFSVDMTEAFSDFNGPFNPAGGDKVHVGFPDATWRFSQSLPSYVQPEALELQHVSGNVYSGSIMLAAPMTSGIEFKYVYGQADLYNEEAGSNDFNAPGRARVRYLLPFHDGSWPTTWSFPVDTFRVYGALPVDSNHVTTGVTLSARVLLEGAYAGAGAMAVDAQFAASRPTMQPYGDTFFQNTPLYYPHPVAVTGLPLNRVDWVIVELRRDAGSLTVPNGGRRLALVRTTGWLIGLDGHPLTFPGVAPGSYYVVMRHRNHLGVMSAEPVDLSTGSASWTFTTGMGKAYSTGPPPMKDLGDGAFAMFAADATGDGQVTATDFNLWLADTKIALTGYAQTDFSLDGQVTAADFNIWLVNTKIAAQSQVPDP